MCVLTCVTQEKHKYAVLADKTHAESMELQAALADEQQKLQRIEQERDDLRRELDNLKQLAATTTAVASVPSGPSAVGGGDGAGSADNGTGQYMLRQPLLHSTCLLIVVVPVFTDGCPERVVYMYKQCEGVCTGVMCRELCAVM
jgi:hypothetical protein